MRDDLGAFFTALAGRKVPGGCESCNAVQVLTETERGVWLLNVQHDPGCPFLRVHNAKAN